MTHHEPSTVGNPGVTLCQEWAMRRGEYDDKALVHLPGSKPGDFALHVTFASLVADRGLERAIGECGCWWLSTSEIANRGPAPLEVCADCREIRHA